MFTNIETKYMGEAEDAGGELGGGSSADAASSAEEHKTDSNTEEVGALTGAEVSNANGVKSNEETGALTGNEVKSNEIDWEKLTDDDYVKQLVAPEGQKINDEIMKAYAPLLRENKIDPKVFQKFLAKDAELQKSFEDRRKSEIDARQAEARKAFKQAGEEFRKEYTPEQVKQMNEVLAGINDDTFKTMVTKSPLANNKTLGKMLLAYKKVYGDDSVPSGGTGGQEKTFEQVWTGK